MNQEGVKEREIFDLSRKWMELRFDDVKFTLNKYTAACAAGEVDQDRYLNNEVKSKFNGKFRMTDYETIGLIGHSMGGATVVTVGKHSIW